MPIAARAKLATRLIVLAAAAMAVAGLSACDAKSTSGPSIIPAAADPNTRQVTVVGTGEVQGTPDTLTVNASIEFTAPDAAKAVSYVRAWHRPRDHDEPDMVLWGEYHDQWVKVDDRWRIKERRVLEAGIEPRREGGVPNPRRAKG